MESEESPPSTRKNPREPVAIGDALSDSIPPLRRSVPSLRYANREVPVIAESPSSRTLKRPPATIPLPLPFPLSRRPDRMNQGKRAAMITRSNLAEQLREYHIRSKHNRATVSFFSSASAASLSRVDVVVSVIWELVILAFFVFSAVSLYFRHIRFAFILVCLTMLLLLCMKIAKKIRSARKKK